MPTNPRVLLLVLISLVLTSLVLTSLVAVSIAGADDWPRWRGPNANQISLETGWNPKALDSPRIVWESQIGKGHSSFAIQGGSLFTLGNRTVVMADDTVYEEIVFCLDAETGKERWRHSYRCPEGDSYAGPEATPYIEDGRIYTLGRSGHLLCLDQETGRLLWQRNIATDGLTGLHQWGVTSSPVVDGDLLLLNIGAAGAAFDKLTGKLVWRSAAEVCGYASPVVFTHQGRRLAAMQGEKTLSLVSVTSGEQVWSYPWNSYQDPIALGDRLLLTGGREGKGGGSTMIAWTEEEPQVLWKLRKNESAFQGWAVIDGHAYGFFRRSHKHLFRCLELETGKIVWEEDLGEWGSFIVAGGKLVIATGAGEVIIAEASPTGFVVVSRAMVLQPGEQDHEREQRSFIWTHPVLANGLLYLRNSYGDLVCVDLRAEESPVAP